MKHSVVFRPSGLAHAILPLTHFWKAQLCSLPLTFLVYSPHVICTSRIELLIYHSTAAALKCSPRPNSLTNMSSLLTLLIYSVLFDSWLLFHSLFFLLFLSFAFILLTGFTRSSTVQYSYLPRFHFQHAPPLHPLTPLAFSILHLGAVVIPTLMIVKYVSSNLGSEDKLTTLYQNLAHGCPTSTLSARYHCHPHTCVLSALWMTELPLRLFHLLHFSILFPVSTLIPFASWFIT